MQSNWLTAESIAQELLNLTPEDQLRFARERVAPPGLDLRFVEARALAILGRSDEAVDVLRKLVTDLPNHQAAKLLLTELGGTFKNIGTPQPPHVQSLMEEASRLLQGEKPNEALQHLIEAKRLAFHTPQLDYLRAVCFLQLNKLGDARECLLEELRFYPDNAVARELLESVRLLESRSYTSNIPANEQEFHDLLQQIRPASMLPENRLFSLYSLAKYICSERLQGNFVECGVAGGGSSALLLTVVARYSHIPRLLFACDTFEGMPKPTEHDSIAGLAADDTGWGTGTCAAPETSVAHICHKLGVGNSLRIAKGLFQDTLPGLRSEIGPIAFLHIDCDWYESTRAVLENVYDQIVPGGVIQVDDYGYWEGMKRAIDEFQRERNIRFSIHQIEGAAWFIKNG